MDVRAWAGRRAALWVVCAGLGLTGCGGGDSDPASAAAALRPAPAASLVTLDTQPTDPTVLLGGVATLTVQTSGPASFQWQRRAPASTQWLDIVPGTEALVRLPVRDLNEAGTQFRVRVSGPGGQQLFSSSVTLRVERAATPASVWLSPQDVTVGAGEPASFHVTAAGTDLAYEWAFSPDKATWTPLPNERLATLHLKDTTPPQAGHYRVKVSNALGSLTSAAARLTLAPVAPQPSVTRDPAAVSTHEGGRARLEVGLQGVPSPSVQWQSSRDRGATWQDIPGATQPHLELQGLSALNDGTLLRARASNASGSVTSASALLTVAPGPDAPSFSTHPQDLSVDPGASARWDVAAQGSPTPGLQWQVSRDDGRSWLNLHGATSSRLTLGPVGSPENGQVLRVLATNAAGQVASRPAKLQVNVRFQAQAVAGWFHSCFPVDGPLATARLCPAYDSLARDSAGDLYVWDRANLIRKVEVAQARVRTLAGRPYERAPGFENGQGVALPWSGATWLTPVAPSGPLYFMSEGALRRLDADGTLSTVTLGSQARYNSSPTAPWPHNTPWIIQPSDTPMVAHQGALWFTSGQAIFRLEVSGRLTQVAGRLAEVPGGPAPAGGGWFGNARGEDVRFREIVGLRSDGDDLLVLDNARGEALYVRRIGSDGLVRSSIVDYAPDEARTAPPVRRDANSIYTPEDSGIAIRAPNTYGPPLQWLVGAGAPAGSVAWRIGRFNDRGHVEARNDTDLRLVQPDGSLTAAPPAFRDIPHQWVGQRWLGCTFTETRPQSFRYDAVLWRINTAGEPQRLAGWQLDSDIGPTGCSILAYDSGDVTVWRTQDAITVTPDDQIVPTPRGSPRAAIGNADDFLLFGPDGTGYFLEPVKSSPAQPAADGFLLKRKLPTGEVETLLGPQAVAEPFLAQAGPLVSRSNAVLDAANRLYVGDPLRGRIWRIDGATRAVERFELGHAFGEGWQLYLLGPDRLLLAGDRGGLAVVTLPGVRCDCDARPALAAAGVNSASGGARTGTPLGWQVPAAGR